jgi:surfactin synthase thioesterase subunit
VLAVITLRKNYMMSTPWLVRQSGPVRKLRLYCFPYAGGSAAAFAGWPDALGPNIDVCMVQMPGRGTRICEAPLTNLPEVVAAIAQVISSQGTMPFAFFGHSLGALLAFEVSRFMMLHYLQLPVHLFVSGCDAPQHRSEPKGLHRLPDGELIEAIKLYNGTPPEVLDNRELMELLLPLLRADFSLVDNYRYRHGLRLPMALTVLAGNQDDHIDPLQVDGWAKETNSTCDVHWIEGDHFFINTQRQAVHEVVRNALGEPVCV